MESLKKVVLKLPLVRHKYPSENVNISLTLNISCKMYMGNSSKKKLVWFHPGYPDYPSNCNAIQGRVENSQHVNIVPTAG